MRLIKEKGVTIIEIVMALGILGIVTVGIIGFFTDSFKFQARSQESSRVQKVADEIFEELNDTKEYHSGTKDVILSSVGLGYEEEILKNNTYIGTLKINDITGSVEKGWKYDVTITVKSQIQNKMTGIVNSTIEIAGTLGDKTEMKIVYNLPYGEWIYGNDYEVKYDIKREETIELLKIKPTCSIDTIGNFAGWSSDKDNFIGIEEISAIDFGTYTKTVYAFWECECCNGYFNKCGCSEDFCSPCGKCDDDCECWDGTCYCVWCNNPVDSQYEFCETPCLGCNIHNQFNCRFHECFECSVAGGAGPSGGNGYNCCGLEVCSGHKCDCCGIISYNVKDANVIFCKDCVDVWIMYNGTLMCINCYNEL